eukprot:scaffold26276_cov48-Phaeocystis_antarctica.AAC.1
MESGPVWSKSILGSLRKTDGEFTGTLAYVAMVPAFPYDAAAALPGFVGSTSVTCRPRRCRCSALASPTNPPPTTTDLRACMSGGTSQAPRRRCTSTAPKKECKWKTGNHVEAALPQFQLWVAWVVTRNVSAMRTCILREIPHAARHPAATLAPSTAVLVLRADAFTVLGGPRVQARLHGAAQRTSTVVADALGDYSKPVQKSNRFDLLIIGGGPVGVTAALRAAALGRTAILIDNTPPKQFQFTGPTGLFSKALRDSALRIDVAVLRSMNIDDEAIWNQVGRRLCPADPNPSPNPT